MMFLTNSLTVTSEQEIITINYRIICQKVLKNWRIMD
jgi:hypothetical protein